MDSEKLLNLLHECIGLNHEKPTMDSTRSNTDGWDSVAHLSLLGALEENVEGTLDRHPKLADAQSVQEIIETLRQ